MRPCAKLGGPAHALGVAGKVNDLEHQAATVRQAVETFGSADLLVNSRGTLTQSLTVQVR